MTARAASWDIGGCGPPVLVVRADGAGERLEGLEATAAGAVDEMVVAKFGRPCVGVGAAATGEAEVESISASREESKEDGELVRVGTSKNRSPSLMSLVCFIGE